MLLTKKVHLDALRDRVAAAASQPFSHAAYPLEHTLDYRGDPGLFGPESATWKIIGDTAAFVGGIRALLIQGAHPEVVAGVAQHSTYRDDPLGRLSRTSAYVTATSYGAMPEVREAISRVRTAHQPVRGTSHRGRGYSAGRPEHAAWVHNALTDSFRAAYEAYGREDLAQEDYDRFVAEQTRVGTLLDAAPLPTSASSLAAWMTDHPDLAPSPGMLEVVEFLRSPPLPMPQRAGYELLFRAAVATVPPRLIDILGLDVPRGAESIGRAAVASLRWALGSSPSWRIALTRVGAAPPPGLFRQPAPSGPPS